MGKLGNDVDNNILQMANEWRENRNRGRGGRGKSRNDEYNICEEQYVKLMEEWHVERP